MLHDIAVIFEILHQKWKFGYGSRLIRSTCLWSILIYIHVGRCNPKQKSYRLVCVAFYPFFTVTGGCGCIFLYGENRFSWIISLKNTILPHFLLLDRFNTPPGA